MILPTYCSLPWISYPPHPCSLYRDWGGIPCVHSYFWANSNPSFCCFEIATKFVIFALREPNIRGHMNLALTFSSKFANFLLVRRKYPTLQTALPPLLVTFSNNFSINCMQFTRISNIVKNSFVFGNSLLTREHPLLMALNYGVKWKEVQIKYHTDSPKCWSRMLLFWEYNFLILGIFIMYSKHFITIFNRFW